MPTPSETPMNGQRYATLRHRLLVALEQGRQRAQELPAAERQQREAELEREFRRQLDELYAKAQGEFETGRGPRQA
jgi:hypothetical protein